MNRLSLDYAFVQREGKGRTRSEREQGGGRGHCSTCYSSISSMASKSVRRAMDNTKENEILRAEKWKDSGTKYSFVFTSSHWKGTSNDLTLIQTDSLFFTHFNEVEILIRGRNESWCTVVDRYIERDGEMEEEGERERVGRKGRTMWLSLTGKSIERKISTIQNGRVTVFQKDQEEFGNEEKEMEWA